MASALAPTALRQIITVNKADITAAGVWGLVVACASVITSFTSNGSSDDDERGTVSCSQYRSMFYFGLSLCLIGPIIDCGTEVVKDCVYLYKKCRTWMGTVGCQALGIDATMEKGNVYWKWFPNVNFSTECWAASLVLFIDAFIRLIGNVCCQLSYVIATSYSWFHYGDCEPRDISRSQMLWYMLYCSMATTVLRAGFYFTFRSNQRNQMTKNVQMTSIA